MNSTPRAEGNALPSPAGEGEAPKREREWHPPSGFGQRLRAVREKGGINPYKLSELCGVHRTVVVLIESGRIQTPKVDVALALAGALGTSPAYLQDAIGQEPTLEQIQEAYQRALERKAGR